MSDLGNREIFAKNLKYYMELNNKDRLDVCRDLGFAYTTFADWCNGNKYPRIDKIEILSNYFGIEKSDLIENRELAKQDNSNNLKDIRFAFHSVADSEGLTEEDIEDVRRFVEFLRNKRKTEKEQTN